MKTVLLLIGSILASIHFAEAQQTRTYQLGFLGPPGPVDELLQVKGFRDGLREVGYRETKNLQLNIPRIKTFDELHSIAKNYVEKKADVIVTNGGTATGIAKEATKEIPIVFISGLPDPVELGFVKSLARPETNITGVTDQPGFEIHGKRLELFKDVVTGLKRVALFYNARGESPGRVKGLDLVREIAPRLGLTLTEQPIKSVDDIDEGLRTRNRQNSDGIFIMCSGLFNTRAEAISNLAIQKKLPVWGCSSDQYVNALVFYEPDRYRTGRRGAWYVDQILRGTKPAELPVEQPTKFELVINLKTAKQIGLTIPPNVLARADRVIK